MFYICTYCIFTMWGTPYFIEWMKFEIEWTK